MSIHLSSFIIKPAAGPRHAQPLDRNRSHACIPTYLSLRIASSERPTCKLPACVRRGISQHPAPAATHHQAHHAGYLPGTLNLLIHESSPKFTGSKRATPATMKMATTAATARTESAHSALNRGTGPRRRDCVVGQPPRFSSYPQFSHGASLAAPSHATALNLLVGRPCLLL